MTVDSSEKGCGTPPGTPSTNVDAFRHVLKKAKRIAVVVWSNGPPPDSGIHSFDDVQRGSASPDAKCSSSPLRGCHLEAEPDAGHFAIASFALPHFRSTIAERSSLTIITLNDDGLVRCALERLFSILGLEFPSSMDDGALGFWSQSDPLLIELRHPATRSDITTAQSNSTSNTPAYETSMATDFGKAVSVIASADVLITVGCPVASVLSILLGGANNVRERGGIVAAVSGPSDRDSTPLDVDFAFTGMPSEVLPQVFAVGERSQLYSDGTVRTLYPGITVIASYDGRSVLHGDPFNMVPMHSRAFTVKCDPFTPRPPLSREAILAMSEEEIVRLCKSSPSLTDTPLARVLFLQPVYVLAENVIVKTGMKSHIRPSEVAAMKLVRQQTSIPVPAVYRYFVHNHKSYLLMEYVRGETLDTCWNDLTQWEKLRIICTLRGYVKQMRRIRTPQIEQQLPGPIVASLSEPLKCNIPALGEYTVGPFASYAYLRDWMNERHRVSQYLLQTCYTHPLFDDSEPLVFTHGDLALRNIILGEDGRLWVIDFGCAGVYPQWFELYGMRENMLYAPPKLWTWARYFVAGQYPVQEVYTHACQYAFSHGLFIPDPGEPEEWDTVVGRGGGDCALVAGEEDSENVH